MSKVPFAEYKIGFEKFLKSESGTIYVQCKTCLLYTSDAADE